MQGRRMLTYYWYAPRFGFYMPHRKPEFLFFEIISNGMCSFWQAEISVSRHDQVQYISLH
jgi:hypothetical protein